jgi:hypothetical protein
VIIGGEKGVKQGYTQNQDRDNYEYSGTRTANPAGKKARFSQRAR